MTTDAPIPFPKQPDFRLDGVPIVAATTAGDQPTAIGACPKCGKATLGNALCGACFALAVNAAGTPVAGDPVKPLRLTASDIVPKDALEHRGSLLPVIVHDALTAASNDLAERLANDPEGAAMLYAQAKDHGLMVMVVVQAAIPRDQQKITPPAVPRRADPAKRRRR